MGQGDPIKDMIESESLQKVLIYLQVFRQNSNIAFCVVFYKKNDSCIVQTVMHELNAI